MCTGPQHLVKACHRLSVDSSYINIAFKNPVSVSTMCTTGFLSTHMRFIAVSLLKTMFSICMIAQKRDGGIAHSEHCSKRSSIL